MSMKDNTLKGFCDELAAKTSVPGGGGAAALCGALAAALGSMVGQFTVGKKKYADVEETMTALMLRSKDLENRLLECIDNDAEAFEPLSVAYGIPKDAPGRDEALEKCLKTAADVPMQIMQLSMEVIELSKDYSELGSKLMISDGGCSAALGEAALRAAALNVMVNTKLMKNREYALMLENQAEALLQNGTELARAVYGGVYERLK